MYLIGKCYLQYEIHSFVLIGEIVFVRGGNLEFA